MSTAQDYTAGWTDQDSGTISLATATTITITELDDDTEDYRCKSFGSDYFSADFEHTLNFKCTAVVGNEIIYLWALSNSADAIGDEIADNSDCIWVKWYNATLIIGEQEGSNTTTPDTSSALSLDTTYYLRIVRDENVGTYGTLYCYIYTDPEYMVLVDTISLALTAEKEDFQYLYAFSGTGAGAGVGSGGVAWTGTISNLALDPYPYTLENIRTRIRDLLNEATAGFYTDAQINRWINDGERDIAEKGLALCHIDAATDITISTRLVGFTAYKVGYVEYTYNTTEGLGLRRITANQVGKLADNAATPQRWFPIGTNIGIEPIPDVGTYDLNLYVYDYPSVEVTADSAIPEIPPEFRPLLILFGLVKGLEKMERTQQALQVYGMYLNELGHTRQDKIETQIDSQDMVKDG